METKHKALNIELRSEEVQELMGKIPPFILRMGIYVILCLIVSAYVVSNYIKYPDIIDISGRARNVNKLSRIKTDESGRIIELINEYGTIHKGDTLAKIISMDKSTMDTICIKSSYAGYIWPCNVFQNGDYVNKDELLFVVVDSVKRAIRVTSSIPIESKKLIRTGTPVEAKVYGFLICGYIKSIAKYAIPDNNTYSVTMDFILPAEFPNIIIWDYNITVRIKIKDKTLFDKILLNK